MIPRGERNLVDKRTKHRNCLKVIFLNFMKWCNIFAALVQLDYVDVLSMSPFNIVLGTI